MYYRDINNLNDIILKKIDIIPRDIDLIVGIPRSGMLPANLIALYLNLQYVDIDSFINGTLYDTGYRIKNVPKEIKNILIVDDSIGSGKAMQKCREKLKRLKVNYNIKFCVIYASPEKKNDVDYFFEVVPFPRYFQWNIFNHIDLAKTCFDIDGVLCPDPTSNQNDDGKEYLEFIKNTPPLYPPGRMIGSIVTSRLEKYRKETEEWLSKNNIKYQELHMLNLPTKEARQKANNHAGFKASIYKSSKYNLFIESSLRQSLAINKICKKPVFCTENFKMIYESESVVFNIKRGKYMPFLRRIALKLRDKINVSFK
ncbi:phosphoribosyltransferase family protein [Tenacibaculum sp. nBUS_03]|uniref:phosphoribosyltransferase family protein n=1 Tax=Tenacibaculum sp. nBUS_03 TaxID=3395320 RepID=UPI003EBA62FA